MAGNKRQTPDAPMSSAKAAVPAVAASASEPVLLREDISGIAILTLDRPAARNSLSEAMLEALGEALTVIAGDRAARGDHRG